MLQKFLIALFFVSSVPQFHLRDTQGVTHTAAEWAGHKAILLYFITVDCPVGNSYVPEMNRLREAYAARGIAFYAVQADPSVAEAEVVRYARDYRYSFPLLLDPAQTLVRHANATVTPQVAVLSPEGNVLYLGPVDNRVEDFGKQRPQATQSYVRQVLDAVLEREGDRRRQPQIHRLCDPEERAMRLMFALALLAGSAFAATPTFNHDIAPMLYENCAGCHRPGQVAPFSLLTYQDAAKRAALIASVTASRYMPPWKAEPGYGHFQNERRLSDAQLALIRDWASHGAPEGDPKQKPAPPEFASGWLAGKPDAVLTLPKPFEIPADGRDIFQCFVIPLDFAAERYVKTVEFHPGNAKVVHHALFFLDMSGEARRLAAASPASGYPCFGGPRIVPAGGLGGWAPGAIPQPLPAGMGYVIEKGADLVIQLHYHPDGKPETDQSSIGLTFTEESTKGLTNLTVGARRLDLAPGDAHYEVSGVGHRAAGRGTDRHHAARPPALQRDEGGRALSRRPAANR